MFINYTSGYRINVKQLQYVCMNYELTRFVFFKKKSKKERKTHEYMNGRRNDLKKHFRKKFLGLTL